MRYDLDEEDGGGVVPSPCPWYPCREARSFALSVSVSESVVNFPMASPNASAFCAHR